MKLDTTSDYKEGTILLVDDQPEQISVTQSLLENRFRVKVAINGTVALRIAAQGGVDLILLDVIMPGMDGYEVCHQFSKAESPIQRKYGGLGLGLATCKKLVGMMAGELTLDSSDANGTTLSFTVFLSTIL